jgi:hypothetical protein
MPLLPPQLLSPQSFHGFEARPPFFEGWYFKFVDAARGRRFAVIPGLFLDPLGVDSHAFVQTLDGASGRSDYHRYPLHDFVAHPTRFRVRVGPNLFSNDEIALNLAPDDPEQRMVGVLRFHGVQGWPISIASPGIMGWYSYLPFMECSHGVLSFDHAITGQLAVGTESIFFDGGRGYTEKDWGQAFPQAWVWMQSNHFSRPGVCLTASVAQIPWLGSAFRGFIVGLWLDGVLYRFATYTGARIERLEVRDGAVDLALRGPVQLEGERRMMTLTLHAERRDEQVDLLHAPYRTAMLQRVLESLTATVSVRLSDDDGVVYFDEQGDCAGLELGGDLSLIL